MEPETLLKAFLLIGLGLFVGGLYLILTRRNVIMVLLGIELMINASLLNLVAFNRFLAGSEGRVLALFVVLVSAASLSLGIALVYRIWKLRGTSNLDEFAVIKDQ